jgi:nucleoside-diphosphate-sugar epimerase
VIWGQTHAGKWLAEQLQADGTEVAGFVELDRRKIGQRPFGVLVVDARDYVPAADALHINMVRHLDARVFFREALGRAGLQEWQDFVVMQ